MPSILITYGTRFGSTAEIADRMKEIANSMGYNTKILDLNEKKLWSDIQLAQYDKIMIGSGIKMDQWTKSSKEFLGYCSEDIQSNPRKYGIFVCCATASYPERREEAQEKYIENILEDQELPSIKGKAFGGVFDFSKKSRHGFINKQVLKMVAKSEENPSIEMDFKDFNDFRDWEDIDNFTENFLDI